MPRHCLPHRVASRPLLFALSLCCVLTIVVAPRASLAQTDEAMAQLSYGEGVQLYEAGSYEAALEVFRRSLSLFSSPNSRLSVAHCLYRLGRYGEAMAEYLLTQGEATARAELDPRYRQTALAAQEAVATLRGQVGWITLQVVDPPAELSLSLAGRDVPFQLFGVPIPVTPGAIEVLVRSEGFEPVRESLAIAAGERRSHSITLQPLQAPETSTALDPTDLEVAAPASSPAPARARSSRLQIGSWISYGVGGVGATLYGVFGALALVRYEYLEDVCGGTRCTQEHAESWTQGYAFFVVANVGVALAAAALVTGVVMTVLHRRRRHDRPAPARVGVSETGWVTW